MADGKIPQQLIETIHSGNCILFLGAGVSLDSGAPSAVALAKELSLRFLPDEPELSDLATVAESVDAIASRKDMNQYLTERFESLSPAGALLQIPTYFWRSIYTTNYDTLLETAYAVSQDRRQVVRPFFSDRDPLNKLKDGEVPLYKLHGCISRINHADGRLVLTDDDLIDSEKRRTRFFSRLSDEMHDFPVLYVGFSRTDNDFRRIVRTIETTALDPSEIMRSFALQPSCTESQRIHWEKKRTALLDMKAKPFFDELGEKLPTWSRETPLDPETPKVGSLAARFPRVESNLIHQLRENFEIIDSSILDQPANSEEFYLGGVANWGLVAHLVGAERDIEDQIIADSIRDVEMDDGAVEISLIHAEAGSGKTALLRRVAASLALDWDQVVVSLNPYGDIDLLAIEQLATVTGRRVFVVIDEAANYSREIAESFRAGTAANAKISFLLAERTNQWREYTYELHLPLSHSYELKSLSVREIERILDKLEEHDALGMLAGLEHDAKVAAFTERADKQLLVALREATAGKRFDDIITDEFDSIPTQEGQKAYLLVAALHRFGIYTRAGLLHRCLQIPLSQIGDRVLSPTEKIIISRSPLSGDDTYYTTRHPRIAEILVDRKLISDRRRLDYYSDIVRQLDLGYSSDKSAFRRLTRTNNKQMLRDFESGSDRRDLMEQLIARDPDDPFALQHAAMMELDQRNLKSAKRYLDKALQIVPHNSAILDTKGLLYLKMADETTNALLREEYLDSAEQIFSRNIQKEPTAPFGYLHRADTYLAWSRASADKLRYLSLAHESLVEGIARCPQNTMLLQRQAELVQSVDKDIDRAREIFDEILEKRPGDTSSRFLAAQLAIQKQDPGSALSILVDGLRFDSTDPRLHFEVADLMAKSGGYDFERVKGHFDAALLGSIRELRPRLAYGAYLFLHEKYAESSAVFDEVSSLDLGRRRSKSTFGFDYGWLPKRLDGKVAVLTHSYGRIDFNKGAVSIYFSRRDIRKPSAPVLQVGSVVSFDLRFNDRGPIAVGIDIEATDNLHIKQAAMDL